MTSSHCITIYAPTTHDVILRHLFPMQAQIARQLIITYGVKAEEIAALTPYSAQREEIRRELRNSRVRDVRVKTITDSQGTFTPSIFP